MFAGQRLIDVSLALSPALPVWPGDPPLAIAPASRIAKGDAANVSRLDLGTHTGTHCDPPRHFLDGGRTVDQLDLAVLLGPALLLDLTAVRGAIGAADLDAAGVPPGVERLLLKTANSRRWAAGSTTFDQDFVGVAPDGARWLVEHRVRLVGIDALSIERFDTTPDYPVHHALLGAGIVVVEGLDFSRVEAGRYTFLFLPLKIADGDGAPGRAVLVADG